MEFSSKDYAKQKFRSGHKRGGRGRGYAPARKEVESPAVHLDSNEDRYVEDEDVADSEGDVRPKSQGADFEKLLEEAELQHSQAYYRHRSFQQELEETLPNFAAADPEQDLVFDLELLSASLAALPLPTLLGLDPSYFHELGVSNSPLHELAAAFQSEHSPKPSQPEHTANTAPLGPQPSAAAANHTSNNPLQSSSATATETETHANTIQPQRAAPPNTQSAPSQSESQDLLTSLLLGTVPRANPDGSNNQPRAAATLAATPVVSTKVPGPAVSKAAVPSQPQPHIQMTANPTPLRPKSASTANTPSSNTITDDADDLLATLLQAPASASQPALKPPVSLSDTKQTPAASLPQKSALATPPYIQPSASYQTPQVPTSQQARPPSSGDPELDALLGLGSAHSTKVSGTTSQTSNVLRGPPQSQQLPGMVQQKQVRDSAAKSLDDWLDSL